AQCQNNLKQIGLAAHTFHDARKKFPAGTDSNHVGALVYILPYLEGGAAYNVFSFDPPFTRSWWSNPLNRPASTNTTTVPRPPALYGAEAKIPTYICPSAQEAVTVLLMAPQSA